jgi:hypothetical protein
MAAPATLHFVREILKFLYRYHHEETVNRGHHVLHAGGQHDSHLLVPVIAHG